MQLFIKDLKRPVKEWIATNQLRVRDSVHDCYP
jgi:hypothetical protein